MQTQLSGGESDQYLDDIFIVVEGGSRAVRGEWSTAVVRIQCFGFGSKEEATGRSVIGR
jgi:hypothetical protein